MINDDLAKKITTKLINSLNDNKLKLRTAKDIIDKCEKKADEINIPVVITVVDDGGNMIAQHKMDDAILISLSASFNKAYTAIALKMPTEKLYNLVQPGKPFYGLENIIPGKLCVFGGGIPITKNGNYIGAVGVSGGTSDQDIIIAKASLE
ncbi:heme-binding protein [uncultured Clostridium sp.]|uniref:GlcG/HbpS family heme-binding protein n=1 Tax=uncultured Clostridium sp. TaxID=59620 RepID=UPI0028E4E12F|nr:heme-binding protein [uncultured Clostridium sp.]